jgi:hypothetical protein
LWSSWRSADWQGKPKYFVHHKSHMTRHRNRTRAPAVGSQRLTASPYVTSSLKRGLVFRLQLRRVLASAVILRFGSRGTHDNILLSQIRDSPKLEGQVPVFISPRNRVVRLYPQAPVSLLVACYGSQGYGEGIRSRGDIPRYTASARTA